MTKEDIGRLLREGHTLEARQGLDTLLAATPTDAELLYLRGQVAMKQSRWGEAISFFLRAERIDPNSPAREAREMLDDIMAFYNKDMYNQ